MTYLETMGAAFLACVAFFFLLALGAAVLDEVEKYKARKRMRQGGVYEVPVNVSSLKITASGGGGAGGKSSGTIKIKKLKHYEKPKAQRRKKRKKKK